MLAIIWHSRTGTSQALAEAAARGAGAGGLLIPAEQAAATQLKTASGYLFICPENLGTMSGAMKEMFDRCYYPLLGQIEGRAFATIIAAGSDGRGAEAQIERIATGWRLKRVTPSFIVVTGAQTSEAIMAKKAIGAEVARQAEELGAALAAGLAEGIF